MNSAVLLCALHPHPDVRRLVLSRCPAGVPVHEAATAEELTALPPVGTLVVLFDPARTAPQDIRRACLGTPELVSISDLRLATAEVDADASLPLRRMTERELTRVLLDVTRRRALAVAG